MKLPNDYDNAPAKYGNSAVKLTPGGHICRIHSATVETSRTGNDMLVVAYDIYEGSEFDGFFRRKFDGSVQYRSNAKWPGVFRVNLLNSRGLTNGFFKGFIESVEKSNSGFNFRATGADESKLAGKLVGFNFGEEEFMGRDGTPQTVVKPRYAVSVDHVRQGIEPPPIRRDSSIPTTPPPNNFPPASQEDEGQLPF